MRCVNKEIQRNNPAKSNLEKDLFKQKLALFHFVDNLTVGTEEAKFDTV